MSVSGTAVNDIGADQSTCFERRIKQRQDHDADGAGADRCQRYDGAKRQAKKQRRYVANLQFGGFANMRAAAHDDRIDQDRN